MIIALLGDVVDSRAEPTHSPHEHNNSHDDQKQQQMCESKRNQPRRVSVGPVDLVQVDVGGLQAAQGSVAGADDAVVVEARGGRGTLGLGFLVGLGG